MTDDQDRYRRGMAMAERIREALEDAFEQEVREALRGRGTAPLERLHDYLTGVADHHEPRVRLLFELLEDGSLELTGDLADVPATCFFLGDSVRYQRSLQDWVEVLSPSEPFESPAGAPETLELWSAGDLLWRARRDAAQASRDFLTVLCDEPIGLWRARVRSADLQVLATDVWNGRDAFRVAVAPGLLPAEQVAPGAEPAMDRPLGPRPRVTSNA